MKKIFTLVIVIVFAAIAPIYAQQLINAGSTWKYLDDGSDQGTNWYSTAFDDSSWPSGAAQLGFGDGDENTVLESGHITYYFRKNFNVDNPTAQNGVKISILRDDGAVVYINGKEVLRSNMPEGIINYQTLASHTVASDDENVFYDYQIPSSYLHSGQNIIAVEVHQRRVSSSDVSFDLKMSFVKLKVVRKAPYLLYSGNNNSMLILWQLYMTTTCTLKWGESKSYSMGSETVSEYGNDHQFKYLFTGLQPGQKYYYRVECNGEVYESSFYAGMENTAETFTFYAYGDTRSHPNEHDRVAKQILAEIEDDPESQTFIVNSGDLVADGDREADWDEQFFSQKYTNITEMLSELPYLAAVGNHEGSGILFAKYFPYPMFVDGHKYYSFDYANAHFIIIDQFENYNIGSIQYNWIKDDLQKSTKSWKIALFHEPGWAAGGHSNDRVVQNVLQPLFEQNGVSLVITGHNHYYARAVVNGIYHITTGGGGAPLYQPEAGYPNIVKTDMSYHFLKINILNNKKLEINAIRQNGTIIETFDIDNRNITDVYEKKTEAKINIFTYNNHVKINSNKNLHIEVYNLLGLLEHENTINPGTYEFILPASGLYLIKFTGKNNVYFRKLIVW